MSAPIDAPTATPTVGDPGPTVTKLDDDLVVIHPDDTVQGGGDDTVVGGGGDDTVVASGDDTVAGGGGDDTVVAGNGDDTVQGGSGDADTTGGNNDDDVTSNDDEPIIEFAPEDGNYEFQYADGVERDEKLEEHMVSAFKEALGGKGIGMNDASKIVGAYASYVAEQNADGAAVREQWRKDVEAHPVMGGSVEKIATHQKLALQGIHFLETEVKCEGIGEILKNTKLGEVPSVSLALHFIGQNFVAEPRPGGLGGAGDPVLNIRNMEALGGVLFGGDGSDTEE